VTLGAKSFKLDEEGKRSGIPRAVPLSTDDVTIYSGADDPRRVTIGRGSVIGGNVWLVDSVPPNQPDHTGADPASRTSRAERGYKKAGLAAFSIREH